MENQLVGLKKDLEQHKIFLALMNQYAREKVVYDDHRIKRCKYEKEDPRGRKRFLELHVQFFNRLTDPVTGENFTMTVEEVAAYYGVEMPE